MAIVSMLLAVVDVNSRLLDPLRSVLGTLVSPLYVFAETPYTVTSEVTESFASRGALQQRNKLLERRVLELSQTSQQFVVLREENTRLRELLGSRSRLGAEVLVAELTGVVPGPAKLEVIVDKGSAAGVVVGQAVIDARGLFGQVVEVSDFFSRVLLITDTTHAVPVQVNRNDVRSIAAGTGRLDRLELDNVPTTADIKEGDLLVSSGLGGRFPPGYPVGEVVRVEVDPTRLYTEVIARPLAALDRSRHVLLIFDERSAAAAFDRDAAAFDRDAAAFERDAADENPAAGRAP